LYFYGARWYDPYLNRWIQPDTIVPESMQGVQAWDRFAYVNNAPTNGVDPSGHTMTQCGLDGQDCGASAAQVAYETQQYYYENCSNGYGGGCPTVKLLDENQALGIRVETTLLGRDLNIDTLYFAGNNELGIFITPGGQAGSAGGGITGGLLFSNNVQGRTSYRGPMATIFGGDAPVPPLGINIEVDFSIGTANSDGSIPETSYVGVGVLQPEIGIYSGAGYTLDVIGLFQSFVDLFRR